MWDEFTKNEKNEKTHDLQVNSYEIQQLDS